MGTDIYDIYMEDFDAERLMAEQLEHMILEAKEEAYEEYYSQNKDIFTDIKNLLKLSGSLKADGYLEYSLLSAFTTIELLFKKALISPYITIAYFDETITELIYKEFIDKRGVGNMQKLILNLIEDRTGFNLNKEKLPSQKTTIWQQLEEIKKKRHLVVHGYAQVTEKEADLALDIAEYLIEKVFRRLPYFKHYYQNSDKI